MGSGRPRRLLLPTPIRYMLAVVAGNRGGDDKADRRDKERGRRGRRGKGSSRGGGRWGRRSKGRGIKTHRCRGGGRRGRRNGGGGKKPKQPVPAGQETGTDANVPKEQGEACISPQP
jgi:hypothetical protein